MLEAQIEHVPLSKQRLLEFLGEQKTPVTARVASVDLDARASTVTEMLERCAAQGLVERDANQRPREYRIADTGRQRLELLRSDSGQANSEPESAETWETNAVPTQATVSAWHTMDNALDLRRVVVLILTILGLEAEAFSHKLARERATVPPWEPLPEQVR